MAWIKVDQGLSRHRKIFALSNYLDIPEPYAEGLVINLWCWALDNAQDGDLAKFTPENIASVAIWRGDPEQFIEGLKESGFLDEPRTLHDWMDYAGKLIDRREKDRQRKRDCGSSVESSRNECGNPAESSRNIRSVSCCKSKSIELEKENIPPIVPHGGTEPEEFLKFWSRYPRKEGRKNALKAWKKLSPSPALVEEIMSGLEWRLTCEEWTKEGGKYIPLPATWLNGERWTDARPEEARAQNTPPAANDSSAPPVETPSPEKLKLWKYLDAEQESRRRALARARKKRGYSEIWCDQYDTEEIWEEADAYMDEWHKKYPRPEGVKNADSA